ncbi:uncharacterized protein MELLADRAFT_66971 [Melampsora larici-populina 98AG31]|uniref:OTU domain-containing protein n=1 Tax=Melampsora larici-populina (strain 98AG31 / pathotype 3-4-7) TaxID=747676 RepID=F4S1B7_MELLP|nr:uncharacterized protein MELLADRAFT_66971 [Melampsora larici-populina 98AG31]EGG01535.1 hypothetical protein MELLADRAFT_66971 [Melampsora larici-populina 98AG31]
MAHEEPPVQKYASEDLYSQANKDLLRYKLQDGPLDSSGKALSLQAIKPPGLKDFAVTNFIKGDGNCQFYAVSMLLQGNTDLHIELRARAVAHIENNKEDFIHFVALDGNHKSWEEYCTNMKKDKEYGDELTLQALARVYQRNFLVLSDSLNHNSVLVVPVQGSESNDMPYLPLYLNQLHYEILLKDNGTPNLEGKNTDFLTNSEIHKSPSSIELQIQATETGGAGIAPVEADTLSDSDRVPLIDHTQPETEHQRPTDVVPSPVYGGRHSGQGNPSRRSYRSRLMNLLLKFWSKSIRSIWKRIMSMFKRHRKHS